VPVIPIGALAEVPAEHLAQLQNTDPGAFSAAAVVRGDGALIVVNDAHTAERQANSIVHELSHLLLGHDAVPAFGSLGGRNVTKEMEDEADWLAGCLLVPGTGIRSTTAACGSDLQTAANHYGVSLQLMRWRHNVTQWRRRGKAA
jgi:Zn-dependent peptidase ImmA (M78 family)